MPGRPNPPPLPACGYVVNATKKGSVPIKVESRAKGKKVTIVSGVQGDAQSLVSALGSLLGCGGSVCHAAGQTQVLVQGDQTERITATLEQLGCLRGVAKAVSKKKTPEVVATRTCAYDKFLRQGDENKDLQKLLENEAHAPQCLPGAECFRWHGLWVYCRGCCQQTDFSDVWEERLDGEMSLDAPSTGDSHFIAAPRVHSTVAGLDGDLRKLGMLAEVGEAAQTWGLRPSNASEAWKGLTLAEYRRKAVAPGARLLEYTPTGAERTKPTGTPSVRAQRAAQKLRAPKPQKPPPEQGRFACPTCGHNFGLRVTLKQHMMLSHGEKLTGPVPNLMKVKDSQPLSRPRERVHPDLLHSHVESCLAVANGKESSDSESDAGWESQEADLDVWNTCPLCEEIVHQDAIAGHVEACIAAYQANHSGGSSPEEESGEASDGVQDLEASRGTSAQQLLVEGLPVCVVVRKCHSQGEHQLQMEEGEEFALEWEQPPE
ncbi:unnamed protein product, partial [Symbiodinium pilosum]